MQITRKVGEGVVLRFLHDPRGGGLIATDQVNGKICRTAATRTDAYPGETWEVVLLGENPKGTYNFVDPVRLLDSEDGIHHLLCRYDLHHYAGLRFMERRIKSAANMHGAGSLAYAERIVAITDPVKVAKGNPIPDGYLRDQLVKALLLTENHLGEKAAQLLPILERLGDIEHKLGNVEAAKEYYLRLLKVLVSVANGGLATGIERELNALMNDTYLKLARIYFTERDFNKAVSCYLGAGPEKALSFQDRKQFATAYARIGFHEMANEILQRLTTAMMTKLREVQTPTVCLVLVV